MDEFINGLIENTIKIINRKWVIVIMDDLCHGKKQFSEFKKDKKNLNNNVLSDTLRFMEENNLVTRKNINQTITYSLTDDAMKLNKLLYELAIFGIDELMDDIAEDEKKVIKKNYKNIFGIK